LSPTFESTTSMVVERKLDLTAIRGKVRSFIDGEPYSYHDFNEELKQRIFSFIDSKPTLRQLTGKFIRSSDHQISQILKFNGPYCSDAQYEKIHLFLMGFESSDLLTDKSQVEQDISRVDKILSTLR